MISYPNYKFTFTIKALGMFAHRFPEEKLVPSWAVGANGSAANGVKTKGA
jgi:lanosterol synthase